MLLVFIPVYRWNWISLNLVSTVDFGWGRGVLKPINQEGPDNRGLIDSLQRFRVTHPLYEIMDYSQLILSVFTLDCLRNFCLSHSWWTIVRNVQNNYLQQCITKTLLVSFLGAVHQLRRTVWAQNWPHHLSSHFKHWALSISLWL